MSPKINPKIVHIKFLTHFTISAEIYDDQIGTNSQNQNKSQAINFSLFLYAQYYFNKLHDSFLWHINGTGR